MSSKNKFGFGPLETKSINPRRDRTPGPMGTAVRDVAENVADATEAKVQQRRQNAEDAKAFRQAQDEGRVLVYVPLGDIRTDDLPRDRLELNAVAASDEMEELKASIRERGQKEPIEVYEDGTGTYQLKKGWRRFTAMSQLFAETGDDAFARVIARVEAGDVDKISRYIDMVEENVVREDLSFAEMAQVAISAADDPAIDGTDPNEMVARLYASLHKTKRSYIRSFVYLLVVLGDSLQFPKQVSRNLGVDVSRAIKDPERVAALRERLKACRTAEAQNKELVGFVAAEASIAAGAGQDGGEREVIRQKFEFYVGKTKVTARDGEVRMVSGQDFASIRKEVLEEAVRAFEAALNSPRVR